MATRSAIPRPFVTANFALTWDSRISTRRSTPADFSSPRDKRRLREIRAHCDAVLVSARTAAADRMTMGISSPELRARRRAAGMPDHPVRVLLTNSGRIDPKLRVFECDFSPIAIFSTTRMPARTREALAPKADLWLYESDQVDLADMLQTLRREYRVRRIVCEGGAQVFRSLVAAGLVDELHVTLCPRIFGGEDAPTVTGLAGGYFPDAVSLRMTSMEVVDGECFLKFRVRRQRLERFGR